jgi:hypothetical protein
LIVDDIKRFLKKLTGQMDDPATSASERAG